jgi:hypothetical protein
MSGSTTPPRRDRDAIIGVAFRRSLFVAGGIGAVVGGVILARTVLDAEPVREADTSGVEAPAVDTAPAPEVSEAVRPWHPRQQC